MNWFNFSSCTHQTQEIVEICFCSDTVRYTVTSLLLSTERLTCVTLLVSKLVHYIVWQHVLYQCRKENQICEATIHVLFIRSGYSIIRRSNKETQDIDEYVRVLSVSKGALLIANSKGALLIANSKGALLIANSIHKSRNTTPCISLNQEH